MKDLGAPDWSALSSAATLMVLVARREGAPLSADQRERILWELRKYVPCYCERPAEALLAAAEPVAAEDLERATSLDALGDAMIRHGSRLLRARDRETLRWAIAASARNAAMARTLESADVSVLHHVWTRARGQFAIDGDFGSVELGGQDAMRAKNPAMLDALLRATTPLETHQRLRFLATDVTLPDDWSRRHAAAFLIGAAFLLDGQNREADLPAVVQAACKRFPLDRPVDAMEQAIVAAWLQRPGMGDRFNLMTHVEDQLTLFVDRPRKEQDEILHALNAIVANMGEATAARRELITITMAVLAQGRSAQWALRPAPPRCVLPGGLDDPSPKGGAGGTGGGGGKSWGRDGGGKSWGR